MSGQITRYRCDSGPITYELTTAGRELGNALVPLALWGIRHQFDEPRRADEHYRAEWTLVFLAAMIDPAGTAGVRANIQFYIDGSAAALLIADGTISVTPGEIGAPDTTVTTDLDTLARLGTCQVDATDPTIAQRVAISGNAEVALLLLELFTGTEQGVGQRAVGVGKTPRGVTRM